MRAYGGGDEVEDGAERVDDEVLADDLVQVGICPHTMRGGARALDESESSPALYS